MIGDSNDETNFSHKLLLNLGILQDFSITFCQIYWYFIFYLKNHYWPIPYWVTGDHLVDKGLKQRTLNFIGGGCV